MTDKRSVKDSSANIAMALVLKCRYCPVLIFRVHLEIELELSKIGMY